MTTLVDTVAPQTFSEALRGLKNFLQWVQPAQAVLGIVGKAAEAEEFLKTAEPELERLREATEVAETTHRDVSEILRLEKESLANLRETGMQGIQTELDAFRKGLEDQLRTTQGNAEAEVKTLESSRKVLAEELGELQTRVNAQEMRLRELDALEVSVKDRIRKVAREEAADAAEAAVKEALDG